MYTLSLTESTKKIQKNSRKFKFNTDICQLTFIILHKISEF